MPLATTENSGFTVRSDSQSFQKWLARLRISPSIRRAARRRLRRTFPNQSARAKLLAPEQVWTPSSSKTLQAEFMRYNANQLAPVRPLMQVAGAHLLQQASCPYGTRRQSAGACCTSESPVPETHSRCGNPCIVGLDLV